MGRRIIFLNSRKINKCKVRWNLFRNGGGSPTVMKERTAKSVPIGAKKNRKAIFKGSVLQADQINI